MPEQRTWRVGDSVQLTKTFGDAEIEMFAELTGDRNPLHVERLRRGRASSVASRRAF